MALPGSVIAEELLVHLPVLLGEALAIFSVINVLFSKTQLAQSLLQLFSVRPERIEVRIG